MPRYDYRCVDCEQEFELVQSFSQAGAGVCPTCSGQGRRLFHAVPVIYKGSGFYTTDYGRPKRPVENGSKEPSEGKPISGDGSSSSKDSKPASTADAGGTSSESSESKGESKDKAPTEAAAVP